MLDDMCGQPPVAVMNNMITSERLQWLTTNMPLIVLTLNNDGSKTLESIQCPDYPPIPDVMQELMVRELAAILAYYGFTASLIESDTLKITKGRFETCIEDAPALMPFGDYLPEQIKRAYRAFCYEHGIDDDKDYCLYCNKQLNGYEQSQNAKHNPDKQLCRTCLVYRQPEPYQPTPMTDSRRNEIEQAKINKKGIFALLKNKMDCSDETK